MKCGEEMAWRVKVPATKPEDLSSIPKPHMGEGEYSHTCSSDCRTRTLDAHLVPPIVNNYKQLNTDKVKHERHMTIVLGNLPWGGFELSLEDQAITQGKDAVGVEGTGRQSPGRTQPPGLVLSVV